VVVVDGIALMPSENDERDLRRAPSSRKGKFSDENDRRREMTRMGQEKRLSDFASSLFDV
jgi:hypothetical protein